jgi:twinkle protein
MSQFKETHQPCVACGSKDARSTYQSGVSICFSCGDIAAPDGAKSAQVKGVALINDVHIISLSKRSLSFDTCKRYGYGVGQQHHVGSVQVAPYYDPKTGQLVAQKLRTADKKFTITGDAKRMGLFGMHLCRTGGKMITITEGEIDAMSVSQAMGNTWPAVSLPNGGGNLQALQDNLDFLESYDKVNLCFDNDEVGQKALDAALNLFSPGKAHVVNLGDYKDANDMLQDGKQKELRQAVWEAKEWRPDGIVDLSEMREEIEAPLVTGHPYPWPKLNSMLYGMHSSQLITWTAGTGAGKTAIISELEHWMLVNERMKVGIIHLEEGVVRSSRRIIGIDMNKPIHLPDATYTKEEFDEHWGATIGSGRCFAYNHFGSLDSDTLLNRIRYLVKARDCPVVVLDHVSMVVSGSDLDVDERRLLDRTMTMLKSLTEETGVILHVISHLSRTQGKSHEEGGQVSLSNLRGTQAIAQLSDTVIAAERNQQAEDELERNTTQLRILKNRYAGITGPADRLVYHHDTGRMILAADVESPRPDMGDEF